MNEFYGKKIAVIGLGVEGLSSAQYLVKKEAKVSLLDEKEETELDSELLTKAKRLPVHFVLGKKYLDGLDSYDLIVRSPGIRLSLPSLQRVKNKLTSQTKLFFDLCPGKIIGVTGTKGKGTTSSLIYLMFKKQGFDTYLGGNIGKPPFDFLDSLNTQSWIILELSSFQLQDLTKSPHFAVMLMITQEHLQAWENANYHKSIEEYVLAKRNLVSYQTSSDFAILNRDYPASNESDIHTQATALYVSREREVDNGCFVKNDAIWVRQEGVDTKIIETKDILLPGKHNLENVCASVLVSVIAGVEGKHIVEVLKTFKGLNHRLELVRQVRGVRYYDDSFSTTPETAIAAIEAFDDPEVLILGGSSKGADFTELGRLISTSPNIKAIIGIGVEWPKMKESILASNARVVEGCKTMHDIVDKAKELAEPGDIILLSPGCASFDMFKNYKDRGDQFKREVNSL